MLSLLINNNMDSMDMCLLKNVFEIYKIHEKHIAIWSDSRIPVETLLERLNYPS